MSNLFWLLFFFSLFFLSLSLEKEEEIGKEFFLGERQREKGRGKREGLEGRTIHLFSFVLCSCAVQQEKNWKSAHKYKYSSWKLMYFFK